MPLCSRPLSDCVGLICPSPGSTGMAAPCGSERRSLSAKVSGNLWTFPTPGCGPYTPPSPLSPFSSHDLKASSGDVGPPARLPPSFIGLLLIVVALLSQQQSDRAD